MALNLNNPHVVQEAVTSSSVEIIEIIENLRDESVRAMVKYVGSDKIEWLDVWGPEDYNIDWTQADLEAAVVALIDAKSAPEPAPSEESEV